MKFHSFYKDAKVYSYVEEGVKKWTANLEDGIYTYSILTYNGKTLKSIKQQIRAYYERIASNYNLKLND